MTEPIDRTAVVTGGGGGIGREIALGLASAGADLVVVGRRQSALDDTVSRIRAAGGRCRAVSADVGSIAGVERLKAHVDDGRAPSIVINAAGSFGPLAPIVDTDPEDWLATLATNTFASYLTARAFAPAMIEDGWGRILTVSSAAALHTPGRLNSAYGTSKSAVNRFIRHLAAELEGTGVTANVFHPGEVRTEMFDDIRAQALTAGPAVLDNYGPWVQTVENTGGDPPSKAVDLVLAVVREDDGPNGRFLWIDEPLQEPLESW